MWGARTGVLSDDAVMLTTEASDCDVHGVADLEPTSTVYSAIARRRTHHHQITR